MKHQNKTYNAGSEMSFTRHGTRRWIALIFMGILVGPAGALVGSAEAATRYVDQANPSCSDTGSGTATAPYCTIGAANKVTHAGDTVEVAAGNYPEFVSVKYSGTPSAPVVFTAAPGATVVVGQGQANAFKISSKSYVTINGFTTTDTSYYGIFVLSSDNVTLTNNDVSHAGLPVSGATSKGIYLNACADSLLQHNKVSYNSDSGIYLINGTTGVHVLENETYNNAKQYIRSAPGIDVRSFGNIIEANISHDNEDSGIQLYPDGTNPVGNNVVVNNISYYNGDHGIDSNNSTGNIIVGNTVYYNVTAGINVEGYSTGTIIANNISVDNGLTSTRTRSNIRVDENSINGTSLDYDLVFLSEGSGDMMTWGTDDYTMLGDFQAASGQESHGIEADPLFVAPDIGDFYLTAAYWPAPSSPAIDSADSSAEEARPYDLTETLRIDTNVDVIDSYGVVHNVVPDTGAGVRTYDDRGALEYNPDNLDDTTPPEFPSPSGAELTATALSYSQIKLTWNEATDNIQVAGYNVLRSDSDGGPYTQLAMSLDASYTDSDLPQNTTFYYVVQAYDSASNVSNDSDQASSTTEYDTTPPVRSNGAPSGTLPAGTTTAILSLDTDENATCAYDTTAGIDYAFMASSFTATGDISQSTSLTGLIDGGSYTYYVRCQDAFGNVNDDDYVISFSVIDPNITMTFLPEADATIREDYPTTNYGKSGTVKLDNSPVINFLMRFNVAGINGRTVSSAKLYLYCTNNSYRGGDWHIASNTFGGIPWSETNVTWNTAPPYDSAVCSSCSMTRVLNGNWYSVDVTPLVTTDGMINFHVTTPSPDAAYYDSRQGTNKPYLQVTVE